MKKTKDALVPNAFAEYAFKLGLIPGLEVHLEKTRATAQGRAVIAWLEDHQWFINYMIRISTGKNQWRDKEDLFQEACVAIIQAFEKYDSHRIDCKDTTYFGKVVENRIKMVYRARGASKRGGNVEKVSLEKAGEELLREAPFSEAYDDDPMDALGYVACDTGFEKMVMNRDLIEAAMDQIPKNQADVLRMIADGYTQKEVAAILGCSQSSVSYWYAAARQSIKDILNEKGECVNG